MGARKAGWNDVRRIALSLPESQEQERRGHTTWCVKDKLFVWERPLRPADVRALGAAAPEGPILGVRVESLLAKDALLSARPDVCLTTPHFDGFPAVLVRLDRIAVRDLEALIVDAWLARAPARLAREYREASVDTGRAR